MSESKTLEFAVDHAVGHEEASYEDEQEIEPASGSSPIRSDCRSARAAVLPRELDFLDSESHGIGGDGREYEMLDLVGAETTEAREWLRTSGKQMHITNFLGSRVMSDL